jgi:cell division initiation protein
MNITPLEIRQKEFEKGFRGYDKEDVKAFMNSLSIEWERLNEQAKELKYKLEASEKEVQKLREVENSLFKTLKTAEDTGANMIDQATKTAELHMRETEMKADALMSEAKNRAKNIIEDAESKARQIVDDMEDEIRQLEQVFKSLEGNKTTLMSELKRLAEDIMAKIGRHEEFPEDVKEYVKKAKELSRDLNEKSVEGWDIEQIASRNEDEIDTDESVIQMVEKAEIRDVRVEMTVLDDDTSSEKANEIVAETETAEADQEEEEGEKKQKGSFFDQFD